MLSNFLSSIDSGTMILGTFFLIVFAVLMFLLNKTIFKENRGITTIIAFCIALLSTWGINKSGFNLSGTFTSIGLSENALYTITPILLIVVVVLASITKDKTTQRKSFSLSRFFLVLGSFMIILGVSPLIYQKGFYITAGGILWVLAIIMLLKKKRNLNSNPRSNYGNLRREQKMQQRLAEKQSRWARKQQEKEIKRRAEKINKIGNRRAQIKAQKELKNIQQKESNLEQKKRQQRQRDYNELLQKYNYYSGLIQDIQRKNRGRIPPLNTKEGRVRHRYIQAMQSIENLARKQGFQMPQDTARLMSQEKTVTKIERREELREEKSKENLRKEQKRLNQTWSKDNKKLRMFQQEISDLSAELRENTKKRSDYMKKINSLRSEMSERYSSKRWLNGMIKNEVNQIDKTIKIFLDQMENYLHSLTK